MPKIQPVSDSEIKEILSEALFQEWQNAISIIESRYDMDKEWHTGGKAAKYELKFRRGGKTLASLFPKEDAIGLMIIFGKQEREKFEEKEPVFSDYVKNEYHQAPTYHDGKWIMFSLPNEDLMKDLPEMLLIKRKPNKKW